MGWLLELLFEAVYEMCSQFIVDMMDVASGMFTEILSCDLDLFEDLFGVAGVLYQNAILPMGIALLLLILVWQLFKSMFGKMGTSSEEPLELVFRSGFCLFMMMHAKDIVNYILEFAGTPYEWVVGTNITVDSFSEYLSTSEAVFSILGIDALSISILKLIMQFVVAWNYFKMLFVLTERYVLLGVFSYTSPLAFATGGSKATNNILASWTKMFGGQVVVVILDAWCVKMFLSAYGNINASTYGFTKFFAATLCLVGFCKITMKLDSYMGSLGVNLGRTGGGLGGLGALVMAGRLLGFGGGKTKQGTNHKDGGHMDFHGRRTIPLGGIGSGKAASFGTGAETAGSMTGTGDMASGSNMASNTSEHAPLQRPEDGGIQNPRMDQDVPPLNGDNMLPFGDPDAGHGNIGYDSEGAESMQNAKDTTEFDENPFDIHDGAGENSGIPMSGEEEFYQMPVSDLIESEGPYDTDMEGFAGESLDGWSTEGTGVEGSSYFDDGAYDIDGTTGFEMMDSGPIDSGTMESGMDTADISGGSISEMDVSTEAGDIGKFDSAGTFDRNAGISSEASGSFGAMSADQGSVDMHGPGEINHTMGTAEDSAIQPTSLGTHELSAHENMAHEQTNIANSVSTTESGSHIRHTGDILDVERDGKSYLRYDAGKFDKPKGEYQTIRSQGRTYYEIPKDSEAPKRLPSFKARLNNDGTLKLERVDVRSSKPEVTKDGIRVSGHGRNKRRKN